MILEECEMFVSPLVIWCSTNVIYFWISLGGIVGLNNKELSTAVGVAHKNCRCLMGNWTYLNCIHEITEWFGL